MKRGCRVLLRLYPADYRARFADEMSAAFDHTPRRHLFRELGGLIAGAASEWIAKLTANPLVRARTLPDIRKMRPAGVSREDWFRQ
jgi:hypothetical protein